VRSKIERLVPEENGDWQKFTVTIERSKLDGNFKLSINGEDSPHERTFRMGLDALAAVDNLEMLVTRMESEQLRT
jgi:hypothetical protein